MAENVLPDLLARLDGADLPASVAAAFALKHLAEADPAPLAPHAAHLFRTARKADDLRIRWNLIVLLGLIPLRGRTLAACTDWLFERLADESPFTRTFALQALWNHSAGDPALRSRVRPFAAAFVESGTPAMQARARKLLVTPKGGTPARRN